MAISPDHRLTSERMVRPDVGGMMVIVASVALMAYGVFFVWRDFHGFVELGLTPAHVGATPEEIRAFSPTLYNYISHLQVAIGGFIAALGVAAFSLAWNGSRVGERARWTWLTVIAIVVVAVTISLPLHYVYGLATLGHLGALYVDVVLLIAGSLLSLRRLSHAK